MATSLWAATYTRWQDEALCKKLPVSQMVPDIESPVGRDHIRDTLCSLCPVRTDCLLYAILNRAEGYWGGTDTAQRRKLSAKKDRAKCPVCESRNLVKAPDHEICMACGLSWPKAAPPRSSRTLEPDPAVMERYL